MSGQIAAAHPLSRTAAEVFRKVTFACNLKVAKNNAMTSI
jgi:hypothetical protein